MTTIRRYWPFLLCAAIVGIGYGALWLTVESAQLRAWSIILGTLAICAGVMKGER